MTNEYTKITKAEWREDSFLSPSHIARIAGHNCKIHTKSKELFIDGKQIYNSSGGRCFRDIEQAKDFCYAEILRRVNEINKEMERIAE